METEQTNSNSEENNQSIEAEISQLATQVLGIAERFFINWFNNLPFGGLTISILDTTIERTQHLINQIDKKIIQIKTSKKRLEKITLPFELIYPAFFLSEKSFSVLSPLRQKELKEL